MRDGREKILLRGESAAMVRTVELMSWLEEQNKGRQIGWEQHKHLACGGGGRLAC